MGPELLNLRAVINLLDRLEQALRNAGVDPLGPEVVKKTHLIPKKGTMVMLRFIAAGEVVYQHVTVIGRVQLVWGITFDPTQRESYRVVFNANSETFRGRVGLQLLRNESAWRFFSNMDKNDEDAVTKILRPFTAMTDHLENEERALILIFKIAHAVVEHAKPAKSVLTP